MASIASRAAGNTSSAIAPDAMAAIWVTFVAVDAALSPIIGQRGVGALYQRSVHLATPAHPWLAELHDSTRDTLDLASLRPVLARQSAADAAAGSQALLQTVHHLLTSLIGPSLTERLLRSVWTDSSSARAAQDTPP